jgi:hypothetical protein
MTRVSADLRRLVIERADACCEYCLLSQDDVPFSLHIEHIISVKHRGTSELDNLCLSCPACNGFKGTDIASLDPITGDLTALFHPRRQIWNQHFRLNGAVIEPLTPEGRVTVLIFQFNSEERLMERELLFRLRRYPCNQPTILD